MTITPQEKTRIENEIKSNFDELKKRLEELKSEVTSERDETKKQQKQEEIQKIESDLALIDRISSLQEQELLALKTRVEEYSRLRQQTQ
jgi:predicted nuclease with TOPRIM domain